MGKDICVDFDGVIHSYSSGWKGVTNIPDPPVPCAFEFLTNLVEAGWTVNVYSSRSKGSEQKYFDTRDTHEVTCTNDGVRAMQEWFAAHGLPEDVLARLKFPITKPAAVMTIDDRAFCFEGTFPTLDWIERFRPWNKRKAPLKWADLPKDDPNYGQTCMVCGGAVPAGARYDHGRGVCSGEPDLDRFAPPAPGNVPGHSVIAGALYDFLGRLTTMPGTFEVGAKHDAAQMVDHLTSWAVERGLNLDNADVEGWNKRKAPPLAEATKEPESGQVHPLYEGGPVKPINKENVHKTIADMLELILRNNVTVDALDRRSVYEQDVIVNAHLMDRAGAIVNSLKALGYYWDAEDMLR